MKILGIDIGGSTTKMVIMDGKKLLAMHQFGVGGRVKNIENMENEFLQQYNYAVSDIGKIVLTGVGSSYIDDDVMNIPTQKVDEFQALGHGASMLAEKDNALIVSMGTGTAFVRLVDGHAQHIGGSGVGGGSLIGLSGLLSDKHDIREILSLSEKGDLSKVDLQIRDICDTEIPNLPMHATAANFGKVTDNAEKADSVAGVVNLIYQTIGMLAVFACNGTDTKDVILTGTMTEITQGRDVFTELGNMHGINFIIPKNAVYSCAIGAVLCIA